MKHHRSPRRSRSRRIKKSHSKKYRYREAGRHRDRTGSSPLIYPRGIRRRSRSSSSQSPFSSSSSSFASSFSSSSFSSSSTPALNSSSVSSSTRRRRNTPHFKFQIGEKIGHKYRVTRLLGTGTFGRVIEGCYHGRTYAIKIIKSVPKYVESAKTERAIVKDLNEKDPNDDYHLVRYYQSFYHHQYYCLVFQPLGKSLYDIIKKNQHHGFPIDLVQSFFRQILKAIGFMHSKHYTHTDLKPENVLLQTEELERNRFDDAEKYYLPVRDTIRIIDFGGATHEGEKHSSIINTRQYRSPEVILRPCEWNELSDVWSIGCIIPELYTGELFFPTHDDIEHLLMIEKNSGQIPGWMANGCSNGLKRMFRGQRVDMRWVEKNFDQWQNIARFKTVINIFGQKHPELADLINKCLQLDPRKRISCESALKHEFFSIKYKTDQQ